MAAVPPPGARERARTSEPEVARRRAAFLAEASSLLASSLDYESTLQGIARLAIPAFAGTCVLEVLEADDSWRTIVACADPEREALLREWGRAWPKGGVTVRVVDSGEPFVCLDVVPEFFETVAQNAEHLASIRRLDTRSVIIMPLVARGRTLGALTFARWGDAERYDAADVRLARNLAARAALAVDNARLYAAAQEAEQRSQFMAEASRVLASSLDYATTLRTVAALAVPRLADWCIIDVVDREGDVQRMAVAQRDPANADLVGEVEALGPRALTSPSRLSRVLRTGRPGFYPHVDVEALRPRAEPFRLRLLQRVNPKSVLIVPLAARGRVLGAATFMMTQSGRHYRRDDLALAENLAERAALAVDNARLYQEAQEAERRSAFLAEASRLLASSLDHEATLARLAALVVAERADWCFVDVIDDGRVVRTVAHADPARTATAERLRAWARDPGFLDAIPVFVRRGEPFLASNITEPALRVWARNERQLAALKEVGAHSVIVVPLVVGDRVLGAVSLLAVDPRPPYAPRDLALCEELARRAAVAIEQGRLHREVLRARAEADHANQMKDEFLATLSHELRSPLSAVLTWAHMLRRGVLDQPRVTQALEAIEQNARQQARLIEDLLDVSRIVTGKLTLHPGRVDVAAVAMAAAQGSRAAAEAKRIALEVALRPPPPIRADGARLQQVVANLISNAVKFTPEGGRVTVALEQDASRIVLSVRDTGIGIPAALLPHVFERFRQADSSITRRHGGLGLGLAIARHLLRLHGGDIEAESAGPGQGSVFRAILPLVPWTGPDAAAEECAAASGPAALRAVRVLVVDDQPEAREFLGALLASWGADVRTAGSVPAALDALASRSADVLLADVAMPDEDGYALLRRVRAVERPGGGRTPAIAVTALATGEDRDRAFAAGFDAHVVKPIDPGALLAAVQRVAGRGPSPRSTDARDSA